MADQVERLVTVWDANFQKLDEKLDKISRKHAAVAAKVKKDADSFTATLEARYGAAGRALGNVFNDSRLATIQAGAGHLRAFGSALEPLGVAGLAAAAGVSALAIATQQTIAAMRFADEIDDASQKLNIGVEALQEYRFAMTEVGGTAEDADKAIEGFTKTLGLAQSGLSPKAMKGFAALGFTREQLDSYASGEEALAEVARRVSALSMESERAAVVEKLGLGPMLPLLREGADRMEELRQKAQDLGYVMDAELVRKGADANQKFETLAHVIDVQLKSAFVGLSDEVLSFTGFIASGLQKLNEFIEAFDEWKRKANAVYGDDFVTEVMAGNSGQALISATRSVVSGRAASAAGAIARGDSLPEYGRRVTAADIASALGIGASRPAGGTRLTPPPSRSRSSGADKAAREAEQRQQRQDRFEDDLARIQSELLRAYDRGLMSIDTDALMQTTVLEDERRQKLRDIIQAQEEYVRTNGLRGLSETEAAQLKAAQDELTEQKKAVVEWERRRQTEEYRFQTDQDAAQAAMDLVRIQSEMLVTAKDRHAAEGRLLALTLQAERAAQERELNLDANLDPEERARRLAEGDRNRAARTEAHTRGSDGARMARGVAAEIKGPEDLLQQTADAYAEIDRLREQDRLSEEEAARAKALINADYNEQRLTNTRSMLDTLASLQSSSNKELAAIGKAAAIAQATIDGVLAVQKALASAPPPFNFVQAAIVGAAAAANVATIAGFERGGYTGDGGRSAIAGVVHGQEYVFDAPATRRIGVGNLEALRRGGRMIDAVSRPVGGGEPGSRGGSVVYAPRIHAPGADLGAVRHLEKVLREDKASFAERVNGVRERRGQYRLGGRRK